MTNKLAIAIIMILIVGFMDSAYATHENKHITIEVSVKDALPNESYRIDIGIPEAGSQQRDNLHNYEKGIYGSDFEIYTYKFSFYDIELNTPYQVCIVEMTEFKQACKSDVTTTDNGHIPIELSVKDVKDIP